MQEKGPCTRGRGKPKGKPQDQRQNPPKIQEVKRLTIMKAPTIITTIPQVRVKAADLIMVRAETDNLEDLYHKIEDKDLNIVNVRSELPLSEKRTTTKSYTI